MDQETYNNLEGFENASGPSTTPSPNTAQPSGTNSYPKRFAPQLFQGQQTTQQSLQQQQHQSSGYLIHQPQVVNYQEPNEETN